MKPTKCEFEFNGSFEDSDLEDSDEDLDEDGNEDDVRNRKQKRIKKRFYPQNKIIMNVSGIFLFFISPIEKKTDT